MLDSEILTSEGVVPSVRVTALDRLYEAFAPWVFGPLRLVAGMASLSRDELSERAGELPAANGPLLWLHGASAGEMSAAVRLAALLRDAGLQFTAGYTATNRAGVDYIARADPSQAVSALVPWDVRRWIAKAFERWHPSALFLIETELWPQLILEAARRQVPVFAVSARIYPRDFSRYLAISRFIRPVVGRLSAILAQHPDERQRFVALGARPERCVVAGNLKYLTLKGSDRAAIDLGLAPDDRVVIFGSIHDDEIEFVLAAIAHLRSEPVRLIIAPRHLSSVARLAEKSARAGWRTALRTTPDQSRDWNLLILNTVGELADAYAHASIAVVGGGFGNHGGHNPLEPLMAGAPVVVGPHFHHFAREQRELQAITPEAQVRSPADLEAVLRHWLGDQAERARVLCAQRRLIPDQDAIGRCYIEGLKPWLKGLAA